MEKNSSARTGLVLTCLLAGGLLLGAVGACDHGLGPVGRGSTGLQGRVTLIGDWPPDTGIVAVALFKQKPTTSESDLPVVYKQAPADSAWFDYLWEFSTGGSFGYLLVAWLKEGDRLFDLDAWVELGFYAAPGSPDEPGEVLITPGEIRRIDLTGDFSKCTADVPHSSRFEP
ncbi:MAG: hypothetical protein KAX13_03980 [Candidatus Krumholzibacteria bacterium]|nr:hypothetical protein [Candidatus Krumholzibacteria bacterium]